MPNIIMADQPQSGITINEMASRTKPTGDITITAQTVRENAFFLCTLVTSVLCTDSVEAIGSGAFGSCSLMTKLVALGATNVYTNLLKNCSKLDTVVLPKVTSIPAYFAQDAMKTGANGIFDFGPYCSQIANAAFTGASKLKTIVLRSASVVSLANAYALSFTPFGSGGTGGTIYIPKSLYDHLGDGTADDYKAANEWSTIDGYGTITWAQIEGSVYENQYADGTPIPSA